MKITINQSGSIVAALEHSLRHVVGLPADSVTVSDSAPTSVEAQDGQTYRGVVAVLRAVRAAEVAADSAKKAFLSGQSDEESVLINQWVSVAATLSTERAQAGAPAVTHTIAEIEHIMESHHLHDKFLAGTSHATIGDVLFYGAVHHGRSEADTKALPACVLSWSAHAQSDPSIAPIKSAFVASGKDAGATVGAAGSAYVKPSDEEIQRRRVEKEKAKKEKEAAKAAAAAASGSAHAADKDADDKAPKEKAPKALKESTKNPPKKKELDASSLDVRVGRFTNVRNHPTADRLYVEDMDLGDEKRTIVSGLVDHFADPKELEGRLILVMCNMKPKALMGVTSHGMILCASNEEGLALVGPPEGAKPGDRIVFGDKYTEPGLAPETPSSNKMGEVLSHLHTNAEGVLCWKDTPAHHANGLVSCPTKKNCIVK